VVSAYMEK